MAAPAEPIARASKERTRFWRAPMLESLPLRISVIVICFLWTLPTAGLFVSSFRNPQLITQTGWWTALIHPFEQGWTLQNYEQVIGSNGMGEAFLNSLIVTIPATVIPITIAAFAAYAFAWIPFRGRGILFIDRRGAARRAAPDGADPDPPDLQRPAACTAPSSGSGWPTRRSGCRSRSSCSTTSCRSCRATCSSPPSIDGASAFQTFIRIVLPLSIPALGAFAIFQFLWVWNDLLVALVFLGPGADVRVMPTALFNLLGAYGGAWHLLTAGAFLTMIVPLLVFLVLQRAFVRGILAGSVK